MDGWKKDNESGYDVNEVNCTMQYLPLVTENDQILAALFIPSAWSNRRQFMGKQDCYYFVVFARVYDAICEPCY